MRRLYVSPHRKLVIEISNLIIVDISKSQVPWYRRIAQRYSIYSIGGLCSAIDRIDALIIDAVRGYDHRAKVLIVIQVVDIIYRVGDIGDLGREREARRLLQFIAKGIRHHLIFP